MRFTHSSFSRHFVTLNAKFSEQLTQSSEQLEALIFSKHCMHKLQIKCRITQHDVSTGVYICIFDFLL